MTPASLSTDAGERVKGGPTSTSRVSQVEGAGRFPLRIMGILAAASSFATCLRLVLLFDEKDVLQFYSWCFCASVYDNIHGLEIILDLYELQNVVLQMSAGMTEVAEEFKHLVFHMNHQWKTSVDNLSIDTIFPCIGKQDLPQFTYGGRNCWRRL